MSDNQAPKWCDRCQKFHPWAPPFDPNEHIAKAAQELADAIDAEIVAELINEHALRKTDP